MHVTFWGLLHVKIILKIIYHFPSTHITWIFLQDAADDGVNN